MHKYKKDTTMKKNFLDSMKEMFNKNQSSESDELFPSGQTDENETVLNEDDIFVDENLIAIGSRLVNTKF